MSQSLLEELSSDFRPFVKVLIDMSAVSIQNPRSSGTLPLLLPDSASCQCFLHTLRCLFPIDELQMLRGPTASERLLNARCLSKHALLSPNDYTHAVFSHLRQGSIELNMEMDAFVLRRCVE